MSRYVIPASVNTHRRPVSAVVRHTYAQPTPPSHTARFKRHAGYNRCVTRRDAAPPPLRAAGCRGDRGTEGTGVQHVPARFIAAGDSRVVS